MEKEVWKKIEQYPNYGISNFGRIMRIKEGYNTYIGKMIKPMIDNSNKLKYINLYSNGKSNKIYISDLLKKYFK